MGNGVVILNRDDFISKVEAILDDASKFKKLDTEALELCQKRENKLYKSLKNKSIYQEVYCDLFIYFW